MHKVVQNIRSDHAASTSEFYPSAPLAAAYT